MDTSENINILVGGAQGQGQPEMIWAQSTLGQAWFRASNPFHIWAKLGLSYRKPNSCSLVTNLLKGLIKTLKAPKSDRKPGPARLTKAHVKELSKSLLKQ